MLPLKYTKLQRKGCSFCLIQVFNNKLHTILTVILNSDVRRWSFKIAIRKKQRAFQTKFDRLILEKFSRTLHFLSAECQLKKGHPQNSGPDARKCVSFDLKYEKYSSTEKKYPHFRVSWSMTIFNWLTARAISRRQLTQLTQLVTFAEEKTSIISSSRKIKNLNFLIQFCFRPESLIL